jgi:hypothetical protein
VAQIEAVDEAGFATDLWGGKIRMDVLAFEIDLNKPAGESGLTDLQHAVLMRLEEGLRMKDHVEGRQPYPPNPPERKVRTIQIHILFKDYRT